MFSNEANLFSEKVVRTETITIRLTYEDKERLRSLANGQSISAFILSLLAKENARQVNAQVANFFDYGDETTNVDDGMPW